MAESGQSDRIPRTSTTNRWWGVEHYCHGARQEYPELEWADDSRRALVCNVCFDRYAFYDEASAAPPEPPRLLDFVSAYFDTVDGDGRPAAVYRAEQDMRKEWERIVSAPVAASPPEPPPLDCGRLARAIDEHIESDCPRDTACDGTCADSIAERYGGAAPDRLPSVEDWTRLASLIAEKPVGNWPSLWERLASIHGGPQDSSRREAGEMLAELWASLHEEPEGTTRPVDSE